MGSDLYMNPPKPDPLHIQVRDLEEKCERYYEQLEEARSRNISLQLKVDSLKIALKEVKNG